MPLPTVLPAFRQSPPSDLVGCLTALLRSCGATLAAVIVDRGSERSVLAAVGRPVVSALPAPLASVGIIPSSIVERALYSGEEQVSANAAEDHRFADDPAVAARGIRSMLGLPIELRDSPNAALYVEDVRVDSFPWSRVFQAKETGFQLGALLDTSTLLRPDRGARLTDLSCVSATLSLTGEDDQDCLVKFAGGLAHQLNNVLQPILGHIDLARAEDVSPALEDHLKAIESASVRAARIVRRVRAMGRRTPMAPRLTSPALLLQWAARTLRDRTDGAPRILVGGDARGLVRVDRAALVDVLVELGQNAVTATKGGLREPIVTLSARAVHLARGPESTGDLGWLQLEVVDNGSGIDASAMARAMDPFFTTHPTARHAGLGLTYAEAVLCQHGGRLELESQVGVGTTARAWLPLHAGRTDRSTR